MCSPCVCLSLDICCLSLSEECGDAAWVEPQWHDQTNSVQLLMNADKATDETDGVLDIQHSEVSLEKLIILLMMFYSRFV